MSRTLILVRHSESQPSPELPATEWPLTDRGRRHCHTLAGRLQGYEPQIILTSTERKAQETGEILARAHSLPLEVVPGVHEHDRTGVPYYDRGTFLELVQHFFARPEELVFGRETADAALARFSKAVHSAMQTHGEATVTLVTHGTVLSLFAAPYAGEEPHAFWRRLQMPAYVAFSWPQLELLEVVHSLSPNHAA